MDNDILSAIAKMKYAFRAAGFEPPSVVLLSSHDEGIKFLSAVRQQCYWSAPVGSPELGFAVEMADGSMWMEVKVIDVAVRWPANKIAMPDGSWRYG